MSFEERFWSHVQKTDTCWIWTGGGRGRGYGALKYHNKVIDSHRASWIIHFKQIPEKLFVLHKCDNRACIKPDHLFLGTQLDNVADMMQKGRHFLAPHGTASKYNYGSCRCILCKEAQMEHQRKYRNIDRNKLNAKRREVNHLRRLQGKTYI